MQGEFFVYASWTEPEELIGIISSSIIHGKERISFTYLSPTYDLNPSFDRDHLALSITENDDSVSLNLARETAPYFRVTDEEADHYIRNVKLTVSEKWRRLAVRYGISKSEQELMKPAFRECL